MSYPAPITNSDYDNLTNLEVGLVGIVFAQNDEHDEFEDREFEDEHDVPTRSIDEEHDKEDGREKDENEKIKVCHFPEGEDDNPVTIEIVRSELRPHLNHGDFFGECEQFGSSDHEREEEEHDRENIEHNVPDEIKEQIRMVLDKFTPEELETMMQKEGPRGTASIISEHTDLSFREAQKLVDFVMKEMEGEQDREHENGYKEKDHEREKEHEFPEHLEDKVRMVMAEFSEEEIMILMDIGPDAMVNAIIDTTGMSEEEAEKIVKYAMKMEKEHERDDGKEDFIGGVMEGKYPTDKYLDSILGGITSGGKSIGDMFSGESEDKIREDPQKTEPKGDLFGGLFGFFGGEKEPGLEDEIKDDFDDSEFIDFDDGFNESSKDVISQETEEKLSELEERLAERDRELEQAQETINDLEDRLVELEKRFELIMELIANQ